MQNKNGNIKGFGGFTAAIARLFCGCERHKSGFTLIEVLVVVLIIGILTSIAVPQYQKSVEKSRVSLAINALKTILSAQQIYHETYGVYATDISALDVSIEIPAGFRIIERSNYRFILQREAPYGYTLNVIYNDVGYCWAYQSSKKDAEICRSVGPVWSSDPKSIRTAFWYTE